MIRKNTRRVLVVDDEPSIREMLSDFLEMNNFICMQADNGQAAVDVSRKEKPDLVILDVRMPGVSGMEALRAIKQMSPEQPIIMVTAVSEVDTAVEAMRLGASDYVIKPFVLHDILAVVDHAMKNTQAVAVPESDAIPADDAMTVAVGIPLDDAFRDDSAPYDESELDRIADDIRAVQRQVATLARRVESLKRPARSKRMALGNGHGGNNAA